MTIRDLIITIAVSVILGCQLTQGNPCSFNGVAVQSAQAPSQRQEVYLGLVLPVHSYNPGTGQLCGFLSEKNLVYVETFFWALASYNQRNNASSDTAAMRGLVFDSCGNPGLFGERMKQWQSCVPTPEVAKQNTLAYLIYDNSDVTWQAAQLFNTTNDILVSVSPHGPDLDEDDYPLFFQMTPSNQQQIQAIVTLLQELGYDEVNVVYLDDPYGRSSIKAFTELSQTQGIGIKSVNNVNRLANSQQIRESLQNLKYSIMPVVAFTYGRITAEVHNALGYVPYVISTNYFEDFNGIDISGSKGLSLQYNPPRTNQRWYNNFISNLQGLKRNRTDVINPWFESYFLQKLNCSAENPCGDRTLGDSTTAGRRQTMLITNAVDIMSQAFKNVHRKGCSDDLCFQAVKSDFNNEFQRIAPSAGLSSETNRPADWNYTLYRVGVEGNSLSVVSAGSLSQSGSVRSTMVDPLPGYSSVGLPYGTRYDIYQVWIIAIGVLAALGIILVLLLAIFMIFLKVKSIGMSYFSLYAICLFGIFIGYLTLFAFIPIPTTATCGIIRFGVGLSYAICLSALVAIALKMLKKSEPSTALTILLYFVLALLVTVELVILIAWLVLVPPLAVWVVIVIERNPVIVEGTQMCNHYTSEFPIWSQFVRTDFENHLMALIYVMVLIVLLVILAFLVFSKRKTSFDPIFKRESVVLLVIAIGTALLWVTWTLIGGLLKNEPYANEFADGAIALGLWFILTFILILLFIHVFFIWKRNKRPRGRPEIRNIPVIHVTENRYASQQEDDIAMTATTVKDTRVEKPIQIIDSTTVHTVDGNRVEDFRNHTSGTNGSVVVTKHIQSEELRESQTLPRDKERFAAQAKLSGASDNVRHMQTLSPGHHVNGHHTTGHSHHGHHSTGHQQHSHHTSSHDVNSSFFCSECGLVINPHALHLIHPKSEKSYAPSTSVMAPETSVYVTNGDTSFAHSDITAHTTQEHHPVLYTKSPYSVHSTTPIYYSNRRPEYTNQRVMRISRDASGRAPSRYGMSFSEYDRVGYPKRSFRRTKSEERLGAL